MAIEQFVNGAATTLSGSLTNSATSLTVASATGFPTSGNFRLVIGTEIIIAGAVSGTTFSSLTRGAEGTTAAAHANGDPVTCVLTAGSLLAVTAANTGLCQGRLTTESGVPVSPSDRTAQSTIYFTPYQGNRVALYSGSAWGEYALTERSLALTGLTSGKNYDVFLYDNAGTLTLELSAAWSSDSARTDALTLQDAVWVKSGATTRRYVGTIRTTGTTTTADAANQLFVWNCYNRVSRTLRRTYTTNYTYATNTIREQNGVTTERLEFVRGLNEDGVLLSLATRLENPNAGIASISVGFGFDSTTVYDTETAIAQARLTDFMYLGATLAAVKRPAAGYHYVTMLERVEVNTARSNAGSDRTLMATVIG